MLLLAIVILALNTISKNGLPGGLGSLFGDPMQAYTGADRFDESLKIRIQQSLAGFYRSNAQGTITSQNVYSVENRCEIKENGYVWQVVTYHVALPSGARRNITHVQNAYILPYGTRKQGTTEVILCETRIVRQVWISGRDTCYGASHEDVLWEIVKGERGIEIQNVVYTPYDGSLDTLFPSGVLDLVDEIRLSECGRRSGIGAFVKNALSEDMASSSPAPVDSSGIISYIDSYYAPLLAELGSRLGIEKAAKARRVSFVVSIDSSGRVQDRIQVRPAELQDYFGPEVRSWRFPPIGTRAPLRIQHSLDLEQNRER